MSWEEYQSPWSRNQIEMRRRFWFRCVQKRFNLVRFDKIADWLCRESNGIDRNETRRLQVLADLESAAWDGDFDTRRDRLEFRKSGSRPTIVWLPTSSLEPLGLYPGRWQLRVTADQISWWGMGSGNIVADLAAPAPLVAAWFRRYGLPIPPWLADLIPASDALPNTVPVTSLLPAATSTKPKNRGGRPPKWDWVELAAEVVRLANLPDGLPTRDELQSRMLAWCVEKWGREPALSMVRDYLARLYPG